MADPGAGAQQSMKVEDAIKSCLQEGFELLHSAPDSVDGASDALKKLLLAVKCVAFIAYN